MSKPVVVCPIPCLTPVLRVGGQLSCVARAALLVGGGALLLGVSLQAGALAVAAQGVTRVVVPNPSLPGPPRPTNAASLAPLQAPARGAQHLDVPVIFQVTRTRMLGGGATTLTESYRETWVLDVQPAGILTLSSRRATVPAYQAGPGGSLVGGPKALRLSEKDLARLVGVQGPADEDGDAAGSASSGSGSGPVTLQMAKTSHGGIDIPLNFGEDEHYAVHIELGGTTVF